MNNHFYQHGPACSSLPFLPFSLFRRHNMSTAAAKAKKKRQWLTPTQAVAVAAAFEAWGGEWRQPGDKNGEIDALAAALSLPPRTIKKRFTYLHHKIKRENAAKENQNENEKKEEKKREWLTPRQTQEIAAAFQAWGGVWEEREEEVAQLATSLGLEKRKVKKRCAYLRSKEKGKEGGRDEEEKEDGMSLPHPPLLPPLLPPPPPPPAFVAPYPLMEVGLQVAKEDEVEDVHLYI